MENPQNPIVGHPITFGYNYILTPASIFEGYYLKEFYSKFESIWLTVWASKNCERKRKQKYIMELVLNSAVMKFQKEFFKQILGITMGTNLTLVLAKI